MTQIFFTQEICYIEKKGFWGGGIQAVHIVDLLVFIGYLSNFCEILVSFKLWVNMQLVAGVFENILKITLMPVAHGKIFCQKSFTKFFMKSFVKISCVVHGKTVCKIV